MPEDDMVTALNIDLGNCDREQIQFPAATLSHGFLLVLQEPGLTVLQAGENAPAFLGGTLEQVLGRGIDTWLPPGLVNSLRDRIGRDLVDGPPVHVGLARLRAGHCDFFVHRCSGSLIAEFEMRTEPFAAAERDLYSQVHTGISRLQVTADLQEFLDVAVKQVREFTGFDRVMAYQFLQDGSGAVRAESVAAGYVPFLGLHYPASDIPLPARRLFTLSWLRHQPDIDYTPVPIVPAANPVTGEPVDLSYALLRSVSDMYSQYLKNTGTRASMVMTLLKNGQLWGLIACHHHSGPRHVPFEARAACEFVSHMLSLLLAAKDDQEDYAYRVKLQATHAHIVNALALTTDYVGVLIDRRPGLLDFVDAAGAAFVFQGRAVVAGSTPEVEQLDRLVAWLAEQGGDVFSTDSLSSLFPAAAEYSDIASGLLAIHVGSSRNDYILWFRPEFVRTVNWAGDPHKPVDLADDGQPLLPRTSFAIWKQTVRGKSRPWTALELTAAQDLRQSLLQIAVRRADQLQVLHENLQRTNAELDTFAYIASHDLKEPLRGIHNYTQFLLEDSADILPAEGVDKLRTVVRLTRRMDDLLDSLLHYARLGRRGLEIVPCNLDKLVAEVLDTLALRIQESAAEVRILGPLPVVQSDFGGLSEVFMNLITNAIKYNDKPQRIVEIGCVPVSQPAEFRLFVRDNGIGIAPEHHEMIFAIFRRLHPAESYGGGTGAGLTIARKILERLGGRIWLESSLGHGSTFYFTIGTE